MAEHTPGPWKLEGPDNFSYHLTDHTGEHIAHLNKSRYMDNRRDIEAEANARLIAAAPEMYEALKAIAMCGFKREDGETWCKCSPNDYDLERAHALLAKIDATNSPEKGKGG